jgi:cytochrome bd-type quinol oxidase subunit 2
MTRGLVLFANWFAADFGWVVFVPLPAALAAFIALPDGDARRRRAARYSRLIAFLTIAGFLVFVVVCLFLPMMALIEAVSGKK